MKRKSQPSDTLRLFVNQGFREAVTAMRQGCCTLPVGETGRVLDRLLLLEKVIGREDLQALQDTHCFDSRACRLTREVTFWVVLAMGILTELPIRQVLEARRLCPGEKTPHRSSLCVARKRLGLAPVRRLYELTARLLSRPEDSGSVLQGLAVDAHRWLGLLCAGFGGECQGFQPSDRRPRRRSTTSDSQAEPR